MSDPTIWQHLLQESFSSGDTIRNEETEKQKLQWQQHRQDNNTLSQAGYTPKNSHKNLQDKELPDSALALNRCNFASNSSANQTEGDGNSSLWVVVFFPSIWSLWCEFPSISHQMSFLLLENSFLAWVKFPPKLHMIQNTFHKNYRMIASSPTPPGDLRSATLHCNRSLQSTVGYTYLNLNSQVEKWIFGAWKNSKLSRVDLHGYLGVKVLQWNKMKHAKQKNPSSRTMPLFFQDWEQKK